VTPTGGAVKLSGGGFNPNYAARSIDGAIEVGEEVMVVDPGGGSVVTVESMAYVEDNIDRELAADRARKAAASEAEAGDSAESGTTASDPPRATPTRRPNWNGSDQARGDRNGPSPRAAVAEDFTVRHRHSSLREFLSRRRSIPI